MIIDKILMKLGLKEKDLATYLESTDFIERVVKDNEYTVTVKDDICYYHIIGWKNGKNAHYYATVCPKSTEKATLEVIDRFVKAMLSTMKGEKDEI